MRDEPPNNAPHHPLESTMRLDCPECGSTRIQLAALNPDLDVQCIDIDCDGQTLELTAMCRDCRRVDFLQFVNAGDRTLVQWVKSDQPYTQLDKSHRSRSRNYGR